MLTSSHYYASLTDADREEITRLFPRKGKSIIHIDTNDVRATVRNAKNAALLSVAADTVAGCIDLAVDEAVKMDINLLNARAITFNLDFPRIKEPTMADVICLPEFFCKSPDTDIVWGVSCSERTDPRYTIDLIAADV